jgi:hypothetical protein
LISPLTNTNICRAGLGGAGHTATAFIDLVITVIVQVIATFFLGWRRSTAITKLAIGTNLSTHGTIQFTGSEDVLIYDVVAVIILAIAFFHGSHGGTAISPITIGTGLHAFAAAG